MYKILLIFKYLMILILCFILETGYLTSFIYRPGREWKFSVKKSNSITIDTLILEISGNVKTKKSKKAFVWKLITLDSNKKIDTITTINEMTSTETKLNYVSIPFPDMLYLKFLDAIPSPEIRLPAYIGYSLKSKSTITMTNLKKFKDVTIKGKNDVTDRIYYDNPIIEDSCWVLNAVGNSSLGTFKAKYLFNEKFGFVYFLYDFNKYKVKIELISIK